VSLCIAGAILGGVIGAGVTFLGALLGGVLENALGIMLNWELTIFGIGLFNVTCGILSGLFGVLSRRPLMGFLIGLVLHGFVFGAYVLMADSMKAAPLSVNVWVLGLGLIGGGFSGLSGGLIGSSVGRRKLRSYMIGAVLGGFVGAILLLLPIGVLGAVNGASLPGTDVGPARGLRGGVFLMILIGPVFAVAGALLGAVIGVLSVAVRQRE
jgi:hypothetical protein